MAFWKVWETYPELKIVYWNYWTAANMTHIHHADKGETEIAMAVGTTCDLSKAKDFIVNKPWYKLRSRSVIEPTSGGINGNPTEANLVEGEVVRDEIIRILCKKVSIIIEEDLE
ncbi:TPA: hypothetical protein P2Q98_004384 [Aeromonas veronii]|nr:hypothetical protein [Aeromonas veronii]HDO1336120.1 hypothetical protein [Aeromonas veronii]HDO1340889.1 hypothetical protein [Aeromonas veronii]HDO1345152.1 hypothetical protein [Aeromonas veronii]HDO1349742.1 hypothetical protein [Aeromonas veronii]